MGQVVRVVARTGQHHDYTGHGPFGDGTFDAVAKGLPVEHVVGVLHLPHVDALVGASWPAPGVPAFPIPGLALGGRPLLDGALASSSSVVVSVAGDNKDDDGR